MANAKQIITTLPETILYTKKGKKSHFQLKALGQQANWSNGLHLHTQYRQIKFKPYNYKAYYLLVCDLMNIILLRLLLSR